MMETPTFEQTMYSHNKLMQAMMKGMNDNVHVTFFKDNSDIVELLHGVCVGLAALNLEYERAFQESNERRSVCF